VSRQAAPDPDKAERDGVANYIPSRRQPNRLHSCADCGRTATWEIVLDGRRLHACAEHRESYVFSPGTYQEKKL
jgi:hypothetical protein